MATYHLKTPGKFGGDVYWKGNNSWTETFDDRTKFTVKSQATAVKETTETINGVTYQAAWFKNSTVVTE